MTGTQSCTGTILTQSTCHEPKATGSLMSLCTKLAFAVVGLLAQKSARTLHVLLLR